MKQGPIRPVRTIAAIAGALALATPAIAQYQSNLLTPPVAVGGALGQTQVFAGAVEVTDAGPFDVALTAHVYLEGTPDADTIYEVGICREDLPNQFLGRTLWRLTDEDTTGVLEGDTVTVTGFDADVTGPVVYTICARALTGAAPPEIGLYARGLSVVRASANAGVSGVTDTDLVVDSTVVDDTTFESIASVGVAESFAYDVALTAHVAVTLQASAPVAQRYVVGICRDSAAGPLVGAAFYQPSRGPDPTTDSIAVTGFDPQRSTATTYHLCVRKVDAGALPLHVDLHALHARTAPAGSRLRGFQQTNQALDTEVATTASVRLAEVEADASALFDVFLTAHAYVEGDALSNDRYAIELCRDDENGARVGFAQWRPLDSASPPGNIGDTVTLTGFDADRTGPTTYVLCGRKVGSTAPAVTVYQRGIVAEAVPVPEPGGLGAGLLASFACIGLRNRRHATRR